MAKTCKADGCKNPVFGGGYCKYHQYHRKDKKLVKIPPLSTTRKEDKKVYMTLRKVFLSTRKECQIKAPGCSKKATCVHHKAGRVGKNYLDVSKWMAACVHCNDYVETHDAWARENDFKVSRLD